MNCSISNLPYLYYNSAPYCSESAEGLTGLVVSSYNSLIRVCCKDASSITYKQLVFANLTAMLFGYRESFNSLAIAMPMFFTGSSMVGYSPDQFVPVINVNAFFMIAPLASHGGSAVVQAMISVWPLILFIWGCTALVAYVFWFIETYISRSKSPFRRTFGLGILDGYWNAFITAATIGYGDLVVQSILARALTCLWITFAAMLFSSMTGSFTSVLTAINSAAVQFPTVSGSRVGVLLDSPEYNIALQAGGIPLERGDISSLISSVLNGDADLALINGFTYGALLQNYTSESAMLRGLRRQITNSYSMQAGFLFANTYAPQNIPINLFTCLQEESFVSQMIANQYVARLVAKFSSGQLQSTSDQFVSQLYSTTEIIVVISVFLGSFLLICVTEVIFHFLVYRNAKEDDEKEKAKPTDQNENYTTAHISNAEL